jgi:hypothetical protein
VSLSISINHLPGGTHYGVVAFDHLTGMTAVADGDSFHRNRAAVCDALRKARPVYRGPKEPAS